MEPNYNPFEPVPENNGSNEEQNLNYNFNNSFQPRPRVVKQNKFESVAIVLGIGAMFSCSIFYVAYIMGALAILFALLSRGGYMKMSTKAKIAVFLGIAAIVLSTVLTIGAMYIVIEEFGSIENTLREYCDMLGLDFEQEFGILFE